MRTRRERIAAADASVRRATTEVVRSLHAYRDEPTMERLREHLKVVKEYGQSQSRYERLMAENYGQSLAEYRALCRRVAGGIEEQMRGAQP